ncbi:MAG: hypothetical protein ACQEW8_07180 [Actinomycetota bacterium]
MKATDLFEGECTPCCGFALIDRGAARACLLRLIPLVILVRVTFFNPAINDAFGDAAR